MTPVRRSFPAVGGDPKNPCCPQAAEMIKDFLDKKFGQPWHAVVGKGFSYQASHAFLGGGSKALLSMPSVSPAMGLLPEWLHAWSAPPACVPYQREFRGAQVFKTSSLSRPHMRLLVCLQVSSESKHTIFLFVAGQYGVLAWKL